MWKATTHCKLIYECVNVIFKREGDREREFFFVFSHFVFVAEWLNLVLFNYLL